ncbi:hypothetical protein TNCV_725481 [Trichonephila clavipes]|nr:hypothetical protein TNCV_725481 [Trichonephila clavipes]
MSTVHRIIGSANDCGVQSRVNEAMDVLRTFHSAAKRVECFEWTPNDANRLNLLCYVSGCGCAINHCYARNPPAITGCGAMRRHSMPSCQVIGQYDDDECSLSIHVHHDATKQECDYLDAVENLDSSEEMTSGHSCVQVHR